jgi:hypothetical protein
MHIEHIIFFFYYINELHLVGYTLREIWLKGDSTITGSKREAHFVMTYLCRVAPVMT